MLIVSQNLTNYDVDLPDDVIYRVNLAWINDLDNLKEIIKRHQNNKIFLTYQKIEPNLLITNILWTN